MFSILKSRTAALIALVVLAFWMVKTAADMTLQKVPDSSGYTDFRFLPVRTALSDTHTLGYPALLRAFRLSSPDLRALPAAQAILLALCVGVFWVGLQCYGFSPWSALAAAVPLFWVKHFQWFIPYVATEAASGAFCVATVGLTLAAISRPRKVAVWVALAIVLFLTYQVRPAYLFLVALVPLMGVLLLLIRGWQQPWRRMLREAVLLLAVSVGPFLGFSALRWAMVGHFGLVSFGGTNAIGVSLEMLDLPTIGRLPPHLRPVALAMRRERQHWNRWEPEVLPPAIVLNLDFPTYDVNVWCVARPIAQKLYGRDPVEVNRRLSEMAQAIIVARSGWYLDWLRVSWLKSLRQALQVSLYGPGLDVRLGLLFLLLYVGVQIAARRREVDPELRRTLRERQQAEVSALAIIALGLFSTQMLVTVLVEPPMDRYVTAAAIFVPSLAYLIVFGTAREFFLILVGRRAPLPDAKRGFQAVEENNAPAAPPVTTGETARPILTRNRVMLATAILLGLGALAVALVPAGDDLPEATLENAQALARALDQRPELAAAANGRQVTLLHLAALRDDPEAVRLLVQHGARVEAADALGLTPLHWAAVRGAARAADALLQAGADVNRPSHTGIQPIHLAGDLATLLLLLDAGADPNASDGTGGTPLTWATDVKATQALLNAKADPNARGAGGGVAGTGPTPLEMAITRGDLPEAEELLANGANPNARNAEGTGPLAQVIQAPHFDAISMLPRYHGKPKQTLFAQLLLKYGADPNRPLPLHDRAAKMLLAEAVAVRCRDLGIKPPDEITMLSMAAVNGEAEVVPLLLKAGSDINRRSGGMTALHWAALAGRAEIVNLLLKSGAAPDVRDDRGQTALDIARQLGEDAVIRQF
jgi:ankyrin repeat protein